MGDLQGMAQTVLGPVASEQLGVTLMHEHLLVDLSRIFDEPADPEERVLAHQPLSLENLSWVTMNWCSSKDNLVLLDRELAIAEAALFKKAGGGTIVDVTTGDFGRDPIALRDIAERTGLHVVMGSGYYHAGFHPADMSAKSVSDIAEEIVRDITEGVDGTDVKAGIIGEVGCSWPTLPNEAKSLRATAQAQRETGVAITIHPGRHVDSPFEIIDILKDAGADIGRVIMGHMERTGLDKAGLVRLAQLGCYLEYDWFGEVRPAFPHGRIEVPSDGERIKEIAFLIREGFGDKVVVAHDVCFKTRLASFGGPGYAHISKNVSRWMLAMGVESKAITQILIDSPRRILAVACTNTGG